MPRYIVKAQWTATLDLHLFHIDNSKRKMQAMVDWYKDIPHIKYVFPPLAHLGVIVMHLGLFVLSDVI